MIYNMVNVSRQREFFLRPRLIEKRINFATKNAAADDVFEVVPVLSGDVVLAAWVNVVGACTANATIDLGYGTDPDYFGKKMLVDTLGHCRTVLSDSLTWDAYEIDDKSELTNEIEITGARYGDHVSVASGMDLADMSLTGEVIHPDWVAVHLVNNTGGRLNLASQSMDVVVEKAPHMTCPLNVGASDTIDITANNAITAGKLRVSVLILRR